MVEDAENLHGIAAHSLQDTMAVAHEAADSFAEVRPCGTAARIRGQAFESISDGALNASAAIRPNCASP